MTTPIASTNTWSTIKNAQHESHTPDTEKDSKGGKNKTSERPKGAKRRHRKRVKLGLETEGSWFEAPQSALLASDIGERNVPSTSGPLQYDAPQRHTLVPSVATFRLPTSSQPLLLPHHRVTHLHLPSSVPENYFHATDGDDEQPEVVSIGVVLFSGGSSQEHHRQLRATALSFTPASKHLIADSAERDSDIESASVPATASMDPSMDPYGDTHKIQERKLAMTSLEAQQELALAMAGIDSHGDVHKIQERKLAMANRDLQGDVHKIQERVHQAPFETIYSNQAFPPLPSAHPSQTSFNAASASSSQPLTYTTVGSVAKPNQTQTFKAPVRMQRDANARRPLQSIASQPQPRPSTSTGSAFTTGNVLQQNVPAFGTGQIDSNFRGVENNMYSGATYNNNQTLNRGNTSFGYGNSNAAKTPFSSSLPALPVESSIGGGNSLDRPGPLPYGLSFESAKPNSMFSSSFGHGSNSYSPATHSYSTPNLGLAPTSMAPVPGTSNSVNATNIENLPDFSKMTLHDYDDSDPDLPDGPFTISKHNDPKTGLPAYYVSKEPVASTYVSRPGRPDYPRRPTLPSTIRSTGSNNTSKRYARDDTAAVNPRDMTSGRISDKVSPVIAVPLPLRGSSTNQLQRPEVGGFEKMQTIQHLSSYPNPMQERAKDRLSQFALNKNRDTDLFGSLGPVTTANNHGFAGQEFVQGGGDLFQEYDSYTAASVSAATQTSSFYGQTQARPGYPKPLTAGPPGLRQVNTNRQVSSQPANSNPSRFTPELSNSQMSQHYNTRQTTNEPIRSGSQNWNMPSGRSKIWDDSTRRAWNSRPNADNAIINDASLADMAEFYPNSVPSDMFDDNPIFLPLGRTLPEPGKQASAQKPKFDFYSGLRKTGLNNHIPTTSLGAIGSERRNAVDRHHSLSLGGASLGSAPQSDLPEAFNNADPLIGALYRNISALTDRSNNPNTPRNLCKFRDLHPWEIDMQNNATSFFNNDVDKQDLANQ